MMPVPPDDEPIPEEHYHSFQVGNTAIRVSDEQFQRGYREGYDDYYAWWAKRQLSDGVIYLFLNMTIIRTATPYRQNAGFVTGWLAALLEHQQERAELLPTGGQKGADGHASDLLHGAR